MFRWIYSEMKGKFTGKLVSAACCEPEAQVNGSFTLSSITVIITRTYYYTLSPRRVYCTRTLVLLEKRNLHSYLCTRSVKLSCIIFSHAPLSAAAVVWERSVCRSSVRLRMACSFSPINSCSRRQFLDELAAIFKERWSLTGQSVKQKDNFFKRLNEFPKFSLDESRP